MTSVIIPELDHPSFRLAVAQFDEAAEAMNLDPNLRERLKSPQRSLTVSLPIQMDNGHVKVFMGYRVQHDSARGPGKGGIRYRHEVNLGEVAALAMWMTWKTALAGLPNSRTVELLFMRPSWASREGCQQIESRPTRSS